MIMQDKRTQAGAEQVKGFVRRLDHGNHIRLEGKAGKPHAEALGFRVFPRGVDGVVIGTGVLGLPIMELFAPQRLGEGSLSGFASAHQK